MPHQESPFSDRIFNHKGEHQLYRPYLSMAQFVCQHLELLHRLKDSCINSLYLAFLLSLWHANLIGKLFRHVDSVSFSVTVAWIFLCVTSVSIYIHLLGCSPTFVWMLLRSDSEASFFSSFWLSSSPATAASLPHFEHPRTR